MDHPDSPSSTTVSADDPRAGWWSWPVIGLSLIFFSLITPRLEDGSIFSDPEAVAEVEGVAKREAGPDWAQLAMLKLQGQFAIAASSVKKSDALIIVRDLEAGVSGPYSRASLAILLSFLDLDGKGESKALGILDEQIGKSEGSRDFLERVKLAIGQGVTSEERVRIEKELGWFSKLLSRNEDGEKLAPPEEGEIRSRSLVIFGGVVIVFGVGMLAMVAGFILLVVFLTVRSGNPNMRIFNRNTKPAGVLLESFALYLALMSAGELASFLGQWAAALVFYPLSFVVAVVWPKMRGYEWRTIRRSIGWHRGKGVLREVGSGVVGYLGMMPIAACGLLLTAVLMKSLELISMDGGVDSGEVSTPPRVSHPIVGAIMQGGLWMKLACLILASVCAPLIEETLFRGALHRHLRGRFRFLISALIGGFIFAALHPQGWLAVPALTAMGFGFCLIREWRDSLIAPMVAHGINNGLIVILFSLVL